MKQKDKKQKMQEIQTRKLIFKYYSKKKYIYLIFFTTGDYCFYSIS